MDTPQTSAHIVVALSQWLDAHNDHRPQEAIDWGRIAKITEEAGEVTAAFIGWTGQNPRKGHTHTRGDVTSELLDVAVTALAAVEHFTDHNGDSLNLLADRLRFVTTRAGITT